MNATNGSIQGEVVDSGGAVVTGALVEAEAVDTATAHKTVTHRRGLAAYRLPLVAARPRYEVKVSKTGFATTIQQNLSPSQLVSRPR